MPNVWILSSEAFRSLTDFLEALDASERAIDWRD